jgi:hypothetical protein
MKHLSSVAILVGALVVCGVPAGATTDGAAPALQTASAIPAGEATLGTVEIGRRVMADGKPLAAGSYVVRLTAQVAQPSARGTGEGLERWVEFVQGGTVKGREVVSIVPAAEIKGVAKMSPPPRGQARVELFKGNDYLRVWINRGGNHYLIHLPVG